MESLLWYLRPSPHMPKHFPFWMSKVNKNVAVSPTDHDSLLSCFDFCLHHLQARCFRLEYCGFMLLFKTKALNLQVYVRMTQYSNLVYACLWIIVQACKIGVKSLICISCHKYIYNKLEFCCNNET